MNAVRKTYLKAEEKISFDSKSKISVERYFKKEYFTIDTDFVLYVDYRILPFPEKLDISFIYIDEKFKEFELKKQLNLHLGSSDLAQRVEKIPFLILSDKKKLHKIKFISKTNQKSSIYVSVSSL